MGIILNAMMPRVAKELGSGGKLLAEFGHENRELICRLAPVGCVSFWGDFPPLTAAEHFILPAHAVNGGTYGP